MRGCASICRFAKGGSNDGIPYAVVSGRWAGSRTTGLAASPAQTQDHAAAVQLADVFRKAYAKLDQASPPALSAPVRRTHGAGAAAGAGVRTSVHPAACSAGDQ